MSGNIYKTLIALDEAPLGGKRADPDVTDAGGSGISAAPAKPAAPSAPSAPSAAAPATPAPKNAPHKYVPGAKWNAGVLGIGSTGPEVDKLRQRLGLQPNGGKFDNETRDAVIQRQKELGVQADGAWGPGTAQADAAKPKAPAQPAQPAQSIEKPTDTIAKPAAPKEPVNVAAPGQPPATAANPSAGTVAGATKAIPTAPVNPANPSGRSSQMNITPDQAQAALDNGSPNDIAALGGQDRLQQLAGIGTKQPELQKGGPAPAQPAAPELQKSPAPAQPAAPQLQKAAPTGNNVPPRPVNIQQARQWARQYAGTHNPDGTPKATESVDLTAMLRIAGLR